jgi:hypothetical protein
MLAAGAIRGIGALTGGLTITHAASLATRALIELAIEARPVRWHRCLPPPPPSTWPGR